MKTKLSKFEIAQFVLLAITVLSAMFLFLQHSGIFENYDKYAEGKLSVSFPDHSTYSYGKVDGLPFGNMLQEVAGYDEKVATIFYDVDDETYKKYNELSGEEGGTEYDATSPTAVILEQRTPFWVREIDYLIGYDAVLSVVKYERKGNEIVEIAPVDHRDYFTFINGGLNLKTDEPFSLYVTLANRTNKTVASFYLEYMKPESAEKIMESSLGDKRFSKNKHLYE